MGYTREELVTIGERFHTASLLEWSGAIVEAARQDLARLKGRGITEQTLKEISSTRQDVQHLDVAQERQKTERSATSVTRQEIMADALDWREEVRGLVGAVYDSEPDVQARFRTGVKVSRSLPKLIAEIGRLIAVLGEHLPGLKGVGAADNLVKRGEEVLHQLLEAQARFAKESAQIPKATADLDHAQGILYTRTRFIVRIAQVEFRDDSAIRGRYSYAALRRQEAAAEGRRSQAARSTRVPVGVGKA